MSCLSLTLGHLCQVTVGESAERVCAVCGVTTGTAGESRHDRGESSSFLPPSTNPPPPQAQTTNSPIAHLKTTSCIQSGHLPTARSRRSRRSRHPCGARPQLQVASRRPRHHFNLGKHPVVRTATFCSTLGPPHHQCATSKTHPSDVHGAVPPRGARGPDSPHSPRQTTQHRVCQRSAGSGIGCRLGARPRVPPCARPLSLKDLRGNIATSSHARALFVL